MPFQLFSLMPCICIVFYTSMVISRGNSQELNIPPEMSREFVKDMFGCPLKLEKGLVDSKNEAELQFAIASYEKTWNEKEKYSSPPEFHSWFCEHSLNAVRCSMFYLVHERAGLGSPPEPFYTNAVKWKNNVLKQHLKRRS